MKVLFFAFANDPNKPLPSLKQEADELFRLLSPGELQQRYVIYFEPFATREKIAYYLAQYKDRLALFHYSGHAGRDVLETAEESSQSGGIAHLLGQCPNLQLVFLNGCSTEGQVSALENLGVPGIIATSAPVEDLKATNFSKRFYQALAVQDNVKTAFELAKGDALTQSADLSIEIHRGAALRKGKSKEAEPTWGLFIGEGKEEVLNWDLPEKAVVEIPDDFTPNELLINQLMESLASTARAVRNLVEAEEEGEEVDFADKRLAILNSLPAPVAEQLRKLMVPLSDKNKGFDKVSVARVGQLVNTYETLLELFSHIQLAQLWETLEKQPDLRIPDEQLKLLSSFFQLSRQERESYNYLPLLYVDNAGRQNYKFKLWLDMPKIRQKDISEVRYFFDNPTFRPKVKEWGDERFGGEQADFAITYQGFSCLQNVQIWISRQNSSTVDTLNLSMCHALNDAQ